MASSNPRRDRIAKSLQLCLSQSIGLPGLRQLGWFDLLQDDWPTTDAPWEVALDALFQLAIDESGVWTGNQAVIVGLITFLKQQTGTFPSSVELKDLKAILESAPLDRRGITQWFQMIFG